MVVYMLTFVDGTVCQTLGGAVLVAPWSSLAASAPSLPQSSRTDYNVVNR
jgi:hypothetical protein